MLVDIGQFVGIEEELRRADVRPARPLVGEISVSREWAVIVAGSKFATVDLAALVIER